MTDTIVDPIQRVKDFLAQKKDQTYPDIFLFQEFNLPDGTVNLDVFHDVDVGSMSPYSETSISIKKLKEFHGILFGSSIGGFLTRSALNIGSVFSNDLDIDYHVKEAKKEPITKRIEDLNFNPIFDHGTFFDNFLRNPYRELKDGPIGFLSIWVNTKTVEPEICFTVNFITGYDQKGLFIFCYDSLLWTTSISNYFRYVSYEDFKDEISQQIETIKNFQTQDLRKSELCNMIKDFQKWAFENFLNMKDVPFNKQDSYVVFFRPDYFKDAKNFKVESTLHRNFLQFYKDRGHNKRDRELFVKDIVLIQDFVKSFLSGNEKLNSSEMYPLLLGIIRYFFLYTHYNAKWGNQNIDYSLADITLGKLSEAALTPLKTRIKNFVKISHGTLDNQYRSAECDKVVINSLLDKLYELSSNDCQINVIEKISQDIAAAKSLHKDLFQKYLQRLSEHVRNSGPDVTLSYNHRFKEGYEPIGKESSVICIEGGSLEPEEVVLSREGNDLKVKWADGEVLSTRTTSARGVHVKDFFELSSSAHPLHVVHKSYNTKKYKFLFTINGTGVKAREIPWSIDPELIKQYSA